MIRRVRIWAAAPFYWLTRWTGCWSERVDGFGDWCFALAERIAPTDRRVFPDAG